MAQSVTRGKGILEPLPARLRADAANKLIPQSSRSGRILDIGCGSCPNFLSHTSFDEKFAIDLGGQPGGLEGITWYALDLNVPPSPPY